MIWARRRFKWAEYAAYLDRIGEMQDANPMLQQQFIMVDLETDEPGVNDHYIGLPNPAYLAAFEGFEVVSEAELPKDIDGLSLADVSNDEFTSRFRLRGHDERQQSRRERLKQRLQSEQAKSNV